MDPVEQQQTFEPLESLPGPNAEILKQITGQQADRWKAVPVRFEGSALVLATAAPSDSLNFASTIMDLEDSAGRVLGKDVKVVLVQDPNAISDTLRRCYGVGGRPDYRDIIFPDDPTGKPEEPVAV